MIEHDCSSLELPAYPSPCNSPTLAVAQCPELDRCGSTSSISCSSERSLCLQLSSEAVVPRRRRGYMKPQATMFADSASSRESVMSLGSIAHLQYYFARTGLLDGKGGQMAKSRTPRASSGRTITSTSTSTPMEGEFSFLSTGDNYATSDVDMFTENSPKERGFPENPVLENDYVDDWCQEPMMLPPTVSTYNHRPAYIAPPLDMVVLRRQLRESLENAKKVLQESKRYRDITSCENENPQDGQGFFEIEGLHILDIVTLAIQAAKNYYTAHENSQRLYSIKSSRQIRDEVFQILYVLKQMAIRNFAGGLQNNEHESILSWVCGINDSLDAEEEKERLEFEERDNLNWRKGDWTGQGRKREWSFLKSFNTEAGDIPSWGDLTESASLPTPFLKSMQNGLKLVQLHNELVRKSRRRFEEIKFFHTDTARPYRCAENLRYWVNAAEVRWKLKLKIDVMGIVYGTNEEAWKGFDQAILAWCQRVREEITIEWEEQKRSYLDSPPVLRVD